MSYHGIQQLNKIFGFTEKEAKGKHPYDIIVSKDAQAHVDTIWQRLIEGDITAHSENENITKDGHTVTCYWVNTPLKKANGEIIGVISMVQDITERKKAEEALQASEAELYDNYFTQAAINMILSESLKNIPLEEFLQKALNMILSIPWGGFEAIGSLGALSQRLLRRLCPTCRREAPAGLAERRRLRLAESERGFFVPGG